MEQTAMAAETLWQAALGELQRQVGRSTFNTWLRPTRGISLDDSTLVVEAPSAEAQEWIERRLAPAVVAALAAAARRPLACRFVIADPPTASPKPVPARQESLSFEGPQRPGGGPGAIRLNPRYTFEGFVVGSGTRMAHAAAQAVAEHPASRYNPLFIYGGAGLGKTHLLHAIGHVAASRGVHVRIASSEQFTNELINAIRSNTTEAFRGLYRANGLLLIDDIQFIAGKESTQEEFFHTFNSVHDSDGQIVITSDRPPVSIATLELRLRSRFEWGLIVDIEPPDLETRIAILRAKIDQQGSQVPPPVVEMIAQAVQHNVRELEGALNRVVMYAKCHHVNLTAENARQALADYMIRREPPSLATALKVVAAHYGLDPADLVGRSRTARISEPRQVAMFLMREECGASYPAIGAELGGRDHTTILHGCEKIGRLMEQDAKLRRDIMQMKEHLYAA
jgi:chromosomal replication initiator protein